MQHSIQLESAHSTSTTFAFTVHFMHVINVIVIIIDVIIILWQTWQWSHLVHESSTGGLLTAQTLETKMFFCGAIKI